jgi:hypothetical protein
MLADIIVLVALGILLLALVWLLARLVSAMRLLRRWLKGWGGLAEQFGMTFESGTTRCSLTGMYRGRIIYILGTSRLGVTMQMTTNNYTSNTLQMKAHPLPATLRNADDETLFKKGFTLESGSQEFLDRLFLGQALRGKLAPLARTPGLEIRLSGEELSLSVPRLYTQKEDLVLFLDALSDLAGAIELVKLVNQ